MQRSSKSADLEAIISSLEKRLVSLELQGSATDSEGLGTQLGPKYSRDGYDSSDADQRWFGVHWDSLVRDFELTSEGKFISGGVRMYVKDQISGERIERFVSPDFRRYIVSKFNTWRDAKIRNGEGITNQTRYSPYDHNPNDDMTGDHGDGLMSERDRRRNDGTHDGTRIPKGYRSRF
jgi:hypothetical protein